MTVEIWQQERPKGRKPLWAFRVFDGEKMIFRSRQVSVRLQSREAALWVARLVEALQGPGQALSWTGDLADDCTAYWKEFVGRAEHLFGPRRGGCWYCGVYGAKCSQYFHTADPFDIQPRSGSAARWLAELVISAADASVIRSYAG